MQNACCAGSTHDCFLRERAHPENVPQVFPTRVSYKNVLQGCPIRVSHKSVPQHHATRESSFKGVGVSHKSARQEEYPTRVFHNAPHRHSLPQELSDKRVQQAFPTRVPNKSVLPECPTRASPTRVARKSVPPERQTVIARLFSRACVHLGSWAPSCFGPSVWLFVLFQLRGPPELYAPLAKFLRSKALATRSFRVPEHANCPYSMFVLFDPAL